MMEERPHEKKQQVGKASNSPDNGLNGEILHLWLHGPRNLCHWHEDVKELHSVVLSLDILSTIYAEVEGWWVVWTGTEAYSMVQAHLDSFTSAITITLLNLAQQRLPTSPSTSQSNI
ncbi:hypothetical protein E2C01_008200 [Portunus trituberculatus]|uniref:Uncharacterized protein n=1 Tax=Portunus trituberculatus TaxID=210409 RepID=A0A5B7D173_PORTR|nr:hypothetical protein [Portunus trituberculatus]